ncbi:MAG: putative oligosaccharyl transferase, partial [bacterium]|nr:putative oligosaccharyl transferase [bacterium]
MNRRIAWIAMLVVTAALAIYLRATQTYATSWAGGQLVPYDTDPYYQLRRLELMHAGDFPPGVGDQFVNAPSRFDCPWPVGLPILLDGIVRVVTLGHTASRHEMEAIAAFAIPVLGALTPLLLMLVLARRHGRAIAALAGVAAAAIPSSRMAGHYGRIDHHVLEPAAALAMFALVFATPSARKLRPAIIGALVGVVSAFTLDLTFVFCVV